MSEHAGSSHEGVLRHGVSSGLSMLKLKPGKTRLRYVFTLENVRLSCGSALLQAGTRRCLPFACMVPYTGMRPCAARRVRY